MSKKVLNVDAIKNELEGASLFFTPTTPPSPTSETPVSSVPDLASETKSISEPKARKKRPRIVISTVKDNKVNDEGTNDRTFERTDQRSYLTTKKRTKIRHTFDIFADQLLSLREIAIDQERLLGNRVLLGDLVQQALDMFITKEKNK